MSDKTLYTDVAIIGAGAAGLAAANALQAAGRDFVLLEASHRIGGRAYTEDMQPGEPFDLGAHWIHSPKINPLMATAAERGMPLIEEDEDPHEFYTVDAYFENGQWLPDTTSEELGRYVLEQFDKIENRSADEPDCGIYDLIDNEHRWAPYLYLFFGQDFTGDVDQVSAMDAISFDHRGNDFAVRDGLGNLLKHYAGDVPVMLNSAVRRIDWSGDIVKLDTAKGRLEARQVILTVSTGVLAHQQIEFLPALPDAKRKAIASLPMGSCTRMALAFDSDVLASLPADFTIMPAGQSPLHFRNRPFGYDYVEVVTGGRMAEWMERSGEQAAVDLVLDYLAEVEPDRSKLHLRRRIVSAWDGDPWTLGSYSYALPGKLAARDELAEPIGDRLFFAGEASITGQQATVHGAMASGIRAVSQLQR